MLLCLQMLTKTFRGMLYRCGSQSYKHFPSPEDLKKKILISTKPPKEYLESQAVQVVSRTPVDHKETSWRRPASVRTDLTGNANDFASSLSLSLL